MKTPRTLRDLENDPRIDSIDYCSGIGERGGYDILLKAGFKFDGERVISVGTIGSLVKDMRTVEFNAAWTQEDED
tara:strand:+ start:476 stop:700 length:225 start_codon:yes stop_codon:yes gene_type:complete